MGVASQARQFGEGAEVAFDVIVVPSAGGEDGNLHPVQAAKDAELFPVAVVGRVAKGFLEDVESASGGGAVGGSFGKMQDVIGEGRGVEAGRVEIAREPFQAMAQLEGAARGIEAVPIRIATR